jgi:hypothetical protein
MGECAGMKLYIWRHHRKFHSYSMIEEPVIHSDLYTHAEIAVVASSVEEALEFIQKESPQFRIEDLKRLTPEIKELTPGVLMAKVSGD